MAVTLKQPNPIQLLVTLTLRIINNHHKLGLLDSKKGLNQAISKRSFPAEADICSAWVKLCQVLLLLFQR